MNALQNRLSRESSPYLQLHRKQQVAWQTWSPETLELARKQGKPILLSIGYSTCHWCQTMSRESFEDEVLAQQMNDNFINIKVDREERPDLDQIYQLAHQMLNGRSGGWPLHAFLCPETQLPFFVGTYYPRHSQGEQLGFADLLPRLLNYFHNKKDDFAKLVNQVEESFNHMARPLPAPDDDGHHSFWADALERLMLQKDEINGGFGSQPKFVMPVNLQFLLSSVARQKASEEDSYHLHFTLKAMAERGINDRIGGGFFRYCSDAAWSVPHFEKMLYDNALLMDVFANAWEINRNPLYKSALFGIQRWMRQFMLSEYGAFFSALDADSGDREGGFYLSSREEIKHHLTGDEFELFQLMFGLQGESPFEGGWHFAQQMDLAAARKLMLTRDSALDLYRSGREKIEAMRAEKSWPRIDHKILTGWNAMAIKGFAILARVSGDKKNLVLAQQTANFIRKNLWMNQRLFGSWQKGQAKGHAFLDDYVYLMDALLELLQVQWRDEDFQFLNALAESLLSRFEDEEHGGFFYTPHDHESLIYRSKPFADTIMPAPNAVAAKVFLRLSVLAAEPRYQEVAHNTLLAGYRAMQQLPENHLTLVQAWEEYLKPLPQVLLVDGGDMMNWQEDIRSHFSSRVLSFRIPFWTEVQPPCILGVEAGDAVVCFGDQHVATLKSRIGVVTELSRLVGAGG
ncbi:MAG: thioredoxin domain-containing protein [Candidatus Pelagadaptatus aseana]|uniref:thioredoxin domain-containing protein n=1 Tax=Candidatus Pelagadaptatus aseana TaxID=3120508 RepID=UPI0039B30826